MLKDNQNCETCAFFEFDRDECIKLCRRYPPQVFWNGNDWPSSPENLASEDISILRELYGPDFLTVRYYLTTLELIED